MKVVEIPKRSGGTRTICVPTARRKRACRDCIPHLQRLVRKHCDMDVVHGFAELRSPVTNALKHVGFEYTITMDLENFFDTVSSAMMRAAIDIPPPPFAKVGRAIKSVCFHKDRAFQGLPSSPMVANLAAVPMDSAIMDALGFLDGTAYYGFAYTRYADDLTISWHGGETAHIIQAVTKAAKDAGFEVNEAKTKVQSAKAGRRIITGVAVDKDGVYPTRATKRRLRAAIHNAKLGIAKHFPRRQWSRYKKQCKYHGWVPLPKDVWLQRWLDNKVRGLEEWLLLKPPVTGRRSAIRIQETFPMVEAMGEIVDRAKLKPINQGVRDDEL